MIRMTMAIDQRSANWLMSHLLLPRTCSIDWPTYSRLSPCHSELELADYPLLLPLQVANPYHPFILLPPHQLAIPQSVLYLIYQHASHRFSNILPIPNPSSISHLHPPLYSRSNPNQAQSSLLEITRILLIQNPDHSTALSSRRNCIDRHPDLIPNALSNELDLTQVILSIPSHSKSSGLWSHRRWALSRLYPFDPSTHHSPSSHLTIHRPLSSLPPDVLEHEFELSLKCCDRYPRNYFAWFHRHWLVHQLIHSTGRDPNQEISVERARIFRFFRLHPRDHSCLNYIIFLIYALDTMMDDGTDETVGFLRESYRILVEQPHLGTLWPFIKFLSAFSQRLSQDQAEIVRVEFIEPIASQLKTWLDSILPHHSSSLTSTPHHPPSHGSGKQTLAEREHEALRSSVSLGIRTFYFLAHRANKEPWPSEETRSILETIHTFDASPTPSTADHHPLGLLDLDRHRQLLDRLLDRFSPHSSLVLSPQA